MGGVSDQAREEESVGSRKTQVTEGRSWLRGSTGGSSAASSRPLIVIAATALVLGPPDDDDKIKVSADGPVVTITTPESRGPGTGTCRGRGQADDGDGLATAEFGSTASASRVNAARAGRTSAARFTWNAQRGGEFELSVRP